MIDYLKSFTVSILTLSIFIEIMRLILPKGKLRQNISFVPGLERRPAPCLPAAPPHGHRRACALLGRGSRALLPAVPERAPG